MGAESHWEFFPQARKEDCSLLSTLGWVQDSVNGPEVHFVRGSAAMRNTGQGQPREQGQGQRQEQEQRQRAGVPAPQQPKLFGEEVVEGADGGEFVVLDVKDGVELGDVEDILNFLGEVEEFEFATGVADRGEAAD